MNTLDIGANLAIALSLSLITLLLAYAVLFRPEMKKWKIVRRKDVKN